jgi:hypothetical protein
MASHQLLIQNRPVPLIVQLFSPSNDLAKRIKLATICAQPPIVRDPLLQLQYPDILSKSSRVISVTGAAILKYTVCFFLWNRDDIPFIIRIRDVVFDSKVKA